MNEVIEVQTCSPFSIYEKMEEIGQGAFGTVFKVKRKSDEKLFAMKIIQEISSKVKMDAINEAKLIKHLDSEEMI